MLWPPESTACVMRSRVRRAHPPSLSLIHTTLSLSLSSPLALQQSKPCDVTDENFLAALVMYGSYLVLFVYFAVEKYLFPQAKAKKGGAAGAGSSSKAARALPEAAPAQAEEETLEVPVKRRATSTKPRKGAKGQ